MGERITVKVYLVNTKKPFKTRQFDIPEPVCDVRDKDDEVCRLALFHGANIHFPTNPPEPDVRVGDLVEWDECNDGVRDRCYAIIGLFGGLPITKADVEEMIGNGEGGMAGNAAFRALARNGLDPLKALSTKSRYLGALYLADALRDKKALKRWCKRNGAGEGDMEEVRAELERTLKILIR